MLFDFRKCKVYKNLLYQSESTVRYLTQILVSKDVSREMIVTQVNTFNGYL